MVRNPREGKMSREARSSLLTASGSAVTLTLFGFCLGAAFGLAESVWCAVFYRPLPDYGLFGWGPLAYGVGGGAIGLVCGVFAGICGAARGPAAARSAGSVAAGFILAGMIAMLLRWRYYTDFRVGMTDTSAEKFGVWAATAGIAVVVAALSIVVLREMLRRQTGAIAVLSGLTVASAALFGALYWRLPHGEKTYSSQASVEAPAAQAAGGAPRYIFLIVADALRADALKVYNEKSPIDTSSIEGLAADGIVFEATAQASWTKPSFGTMLTSLHPDTHTATQELSLLPEELTTFPEALQAGGYYTKALSNCNPNFSFEMNFHQGFWEFTQITPAHFSLGAPPSAVRLMVYRKLMGEGDRDDTHVRIRNYYLPAEGITERALAWLDSAKRSPEGPAFVLIHYMDPHDPFMNGRDEGTGYVRRRLKSPDPALAEEMHGAYLGDVERMAASIGELLEGLRARNIYDDSLILFVSDHGEEFYDHGGWWHGDTLYDELIGVPMIVKLPQNAGAGTRNPYIARHVDIGPTILSFAGIQPPPNMKGVPLVSASGEPRNGDVEFAFAQTDVHGIRLRAVRDRDTKLIMSLEDEVDRFDDVELYDLVEDPRERENRYDPTLPEATRLMEYLSTMKTLNEGGAQQSTKELTPEVRQQLEALGYIE